MSNIVTDITDATTVVLALTPKRLLAYTKPMTYASWKLATQQRYPC